MVLFTSVIEQLREEPPNKAPFEDAARRAPQPGKSIEINGVSPYPLNIHREK
jgi:hypothetical protein